MTKQVLYDINGNILQWQDTGLFSYPEPSNGNKVLTVTETQWKKQDTLKWVVDGKVTETSPFPTTPSDELLKETIRYKRNRLLRSSDWTQVPDAPVDKEAWTKYRQALRDITEQEGFPTTVTWPEEP